MTILKSMVMCLALANVGYFLWANGIAKSDEAPAPPAVATLKLVSEVPQAVPAATTGNDAAAGALPDGAARCISVGPFRDVAEAARAASTLRGGGRDPRQRVVDGEVWAGVWVYLPRPATAAAKDLLLAKLKGAGIDDALEMPGPGEEPVISLGLYSEQKRAQARVAQANALGLEPGIADRKRTGSVYWIDMDLKTADEVPKAADLHGEAGRISRLEVKSCPAAGQS